MSGRHLLDTSVVIAAIRGDRGIADRLRDSSGVFLPVVALGELHYGAAHSDRPEQNAAQVEDFTSACTLLDIDPETARIYGRIKGDLRKQGCLIPENDVWIAAVALRHHLTLAARDEHFRKVQDLKLVDW